MAHLQDNIPTFRCAQIHINRAAFQMSLYPTSLSYYIFFSIIKWALEDLSTCISSVDLPQSVVFALAMILESYQVTFLFKTSEYSIDIECRCISIFKVLTYL